MSEFLAALPALVKLAQELWAFIKKAAGDDPRRFLSDTAQAFAELNQSQSSEERREAARKLADLWHRS